LAKAGFQVNLVAPGDRNELRDNINIHVFPIPKSRFYRVTAGLYHIYQFAKKFDADFYHIHDPDLILIGLFLQKNGKKVIYDVHEDHPRNLLSRRYIPIKLRKPISLVYEKLENYAAKYFSAIIAATPVIGERFQKINPKIVVVNNFPLLDELKPIGNKRWDGRDISICYIGAITHVRGAVQTIQAMEYLPRNIGAKLELAGEIWPDELRKQIQVLEGWRYVKELGILSREEVKKLLARTRAGLLLIHPEPNYIKSHPTKLFEYMSAGIPVVASDFPLWRQIIEDSGCGLLADPMDPLSIAEAIKILLTRDEEAEAMGKRGREAVETKYNWNTEEEKLLSLYADLACK
jgi:glycosyltransferase involved in cell wall biosynthesis